MCIRDRGHVWQIVDDEPLGTSVATFAKTIKQSSVYVATNEPEDAVDSGAAAFAFPSAAGLPTEPARTATQDAPGATNEDSGDILDWFLATGAHRASDTWQSATAGW